MIKPTSIIKKNKNVVCNINGNKTVLVPLVNDIADMKVIHSLNEQGGFIWTIIDDKKTVQEIAASIVNGFNVSFEVALADLIVFFEELSSKKMIIIN